MPLRTFVLVGSITNLTDARYCAGMGVDMLGFRTTEGHQSYIPPSHFQEIRGWITGPLMVAEIYGLTNPASLTAILENYKPDYLALGLAELKLLPSIPLPFLLSIEETDVIEDISPAPTYFIGRTPFQTSIPLLIEVQSKDDAMAMLHDDKVKGIVLQGGSELKPGLKDLEAMHEVLEYLEED